MFLRFFRNAILRETYGEQGNNGGRLDRARMYGQRFPTPEIVVAKERQPVASD